MPLLKTPAVFDIYEGEAYGMDWASILERSPLAVISRASLQFLGKRERRADLEVMNYVAKCKELGIKYGLYHFLTPNGIAEQAALFISVWNQCGGATLPPIVDVEVNLPVSYPHATKKGESSIGNKVWQDHVKLFLDLVSAGTGRTPMIYTNQNYWQFVCTKNTFGAWVAPAWIASYPLWVAQYPNNPDSATAPAALPLGWTSWALWQYHDMGRVNGLPVNDLNVASAEFAAEIGDVVIPDPDPEEPPTETKPDSIVISYEENGTTKSATFTRSTPWQ